MDNSEFIKSPVIKVTIALITYNRVLYLKSAIDGIINQTFKDFEFLIMDNGSSSETKDLVSGYDDPRIIYIRNERNERDFYNAAFMRSNGDFLLITHDDDVLLPDFIARTVEILSDNPSAIIVATNAFAIDHEGTKVKSNIMDINYNLTFQQYEYIKYYLSGFPGIVCPTALLRKKFFLDEKLFFDFEKGPATDSFLWTLCNLFEKEIIVLSEQLYAYRTHALQDSIKNNLYMNSKLYLELFKLFRNHEGLDKFLKVVYSRCLLNCVLEFKYNCISISDCSDSLKKLRNSEFGIVLISYNLILNSIVRFSSELALFISRVFYWFERRMLKNN